MRPPPFRTSLRHVTALALPHPIRRIDPRLVDGLIATAFVAVGQLDVWLGLAAGG